jgi:hypothetical protein
MSRIIGEVGGNKLDEAQAIFESYNRAMEKGYNKALLGRRHEEISKVTTEEIDLNVELSIKEWMVSPLNAIGKITPIHFFENVLSLNEAVKLFITGSKMCDKGLPDILVAKLKSFGEGAIDELIRLASEDDYTSGEENIFISLMAIELLGRWKIKKAITSLIQMLYKCNPDFEIVMEGIIDALIMLGRDSINPIINRLELADKTGLADEYLLTALVKVGKEYKSDNVYRCIKSSFLKIKDKILGAMCIADYGDGRAIPMLIGYIEKNKSSLNKETYFEIKRAVKQLGGDISHI